jgi:hypothetical protein
MKIFQKIAGLVEAIENCKKSGNKEWEDRHSDAIEDLVKNHLPSGSGFDAGTKFGFMVSNPERLVFLTDFHHLNENGYYDGWTSHKIIVTPSLASGFDLKVTGRDRNGIKEYIAECFHEELNSPALLECPEEASKTNITEESNA